MSLFRLTALLVISACSVSCASRAVWKATDPTEYIRISNDQISEATLKREGRDYRKSDDPEVYLVEKTALQKVGDYAARAMLLPMALAYDITVGWLAVAIAMLLPGEPTDSSSELNDPLRGFRPTPEPDYILK